MITIGIIGPSWTNSRIKRSMDMFPNFDPIYQTSNNIYDAPEFTKTLIGKCDVLLYSGFIPYSISKHEIPSNLPAHFIPIKGSSLYRSLYKLQKRLTNFNMISIDTLSPHEINRINQELNESITSIHYNSRLSLAKTDEIVAFHEAAYKKQKTDCALTGLKVVS